MDFNCFMIGKNKGEKSKQLGTFPVMSPINMVIHQFNVHTGSYSMEELWLMVTLFPPV